MELRSCSHLHYIQTLKGGLVVKICNINSQGRPALVYKTLNDIYQSGDLQTLGASSKFELNKNLVSDCDGVNAEGQYPTMVERKTMEMDPKPNDFDKSGSDNEKESDSEDLVFGKMTLKQLKGIYKSKKRKLSKSVDLAPKQESISTQPEENFIDLDEPLSNWKLKLPKNPKAKKKCIRRSASTSETAISVISEQPITVKAEILEPDCSEQNIISVADFSSSSCYNQLDFHGPESGEILETVNQELETRQPVFSKEECQNCVLNEAPYVHLEDEEPSSPFLFLAEENKSINNKEQACQKKLVFPVEEFKIDTNVNHQLPDEVSLEDSSSAPTQSSEMSDSHEISDQSGHISRESEVQVSDKSNDDSFSVCSSPVNYSVSMEDSLGSEENQPSKSTLADAETSCSNPDDELVVSVEGYSVAEEQEPLILVSVDSETFSTASDPCNIANEIPTSPIRNTHDMETGHTPERLLSTRKAISPMSQERLCLAMKSIELEDDADHYECKEKNCPAENTDLLAGSGIEGEELSLDAINPALTNGKKVMKHILKKSIPFKRGSPQKKGSPLKGSFDGPRLSRSLPRLSTGSTSVQGCSKSAIAFSQRQMHDFESIAMKLVNELNSMKDIVEGKLLYEAYRSNSIKNDADEVKMAIKRATKTEDMTRKWLSMMARDCNRFCKIMRLSEDGGATTAHNVIQKERKKITFADEAGGMLCHVKLFENGMASVDSNGRL